MTPEGESGGSECIVPGRGEGEVGLRLRRGAIESAPAAAGSSLVESRHLDQHFGQQWIGRGDPIAWSASSPDLTLLDYFPWGHMKGLVYETPVESEEDLLERIMAAAYLGLSGNGDRVMVRQCADGGIGRGACEMKPFPGYSYGPMELWNDYGANRLTGCRVGDVYVTSQAACDARYICHNLGTTVGKFPTRLHNARYRETSMDTISVLIDIPFLRARILSALQAPMPSNTIPEISSKPAEHWWDRGALLPPRLLDCEAPADGSKRQLQQPSYRDVKTCGCATSHFLFDEAICGYAIARKYHYIIMSDKFIFPVYTYVPRPAIAPVIEKEKGLHRTEFRQRSGMFRIEAVFMCYFIPFLLATKYSSPLRWGWIRGWFGGESAPMYRFEYRPTHSGVGGVFMWAGNSPQNSRSADLGARLPTPFPTNPHRLFPYRTNPSGYSSLI
ncbi:hypothetical protein PR048_009125 [Dryococelus australis]|uniref:Uncharacterized protein n=1 Tax=Dryococelus australis TaxID=614101 RepID=A0ABQ9HZ00_9NEOP|nr:hypothetical protein PR048_009125 [Dryococelus australis]